MTVFEMHQTAPNRNLDILGLKHGASPDEIRTAYRELVKVWHPDRFADDKNLQVKAQEKLSEINRAFEELSRPAENAPSSAAASPFVMPVTAAPVMSERTASLAPKGIHVLFWIAALIVVPLAAYALHGVISQYRLSSAIIADQASTFTNEGIRRFLLNDPATKEFYIIEGPRAPMDWEKEALLSAYTAHHPRAKQVVGSFSISQSVKPGDEAYQTIEKDGGML